MSSEIAALKEKIATHTVIDPARVDALNHLAELQLEKDAIQSYDTSRSATTEARLIAYLPGEALALLNTGLALSNQRKYHDACELYERALALYQQLNNLEGQAVVLSKAGNANLFLANYKEALAHYDQAINIRTQLNDELGIADLNSNTGIIYGFQGNYSPALRSHMNAMKTYERLDVPSRIASAAQNIGLLYKEQHNYEDSLKMLHKALDIRQRANDKKAVSDLLNNLGNIYYEQAKYEQAIEMHKSALQLRIELKDKDKIGSSLCNLADVYKTIGEYNTALRSYANALALFHEINEKRKLAAAYSNLGELHFLMDDPAEAHINLNEAIRLAEDSGLRDHLRKTFETKGKLFAREHNFEQAYQYQLKFMQLDKEISNSETSKQIAQMFLRYELEQKEREAELERTKHAELTRAYNSLDEEKQRADKLLLNILPEEVSAELKQFGKTRARSFEQVTVMFADIQGFTRISEQLSAEEIVSGIDEYFEAFDKIIGNYNIEKIKTIGDAYLCAAGIPIISDDHAEMIVLAAKDFLQVSEQLRQQRQQQGKPTFDFRIGIHTGPVVAGVVGIKKFAYDIWGDTVNTASRMQQNSEPNRINISQNTYQFINNKFPCTYRGEIEAKNKGKLKMYFVELG